MVRLTTLALALLAVQCHATTLEKLSFNDMIDQSTMVVRVTVMGNTGVLQNGAIYTQYDLAVKDRLKGGKSGGMQLFVPGGTASGLRQLVPGAPVLATGGDYLIFVWVGKSGRPQIIGLSQGLFQMRKDAASGQWFAERAGADEVMLDARSGRPVADESVRMRFVDVKAKVAARAPQASGK